MAKTLDETVAEALGSAAPVTAPAAMRTVEKVNWIPRSLSEYSKDDVTKIVAYVKAQQAADTLKKELNKAGGIHEAALKRRLAACVAFIAKNGKNAAHKDTCEKIVAYMNIWNTDAAGNLPTHLSRAWVSTIRKDKDGNDYVDIKGANVKPFERRTGKANDRFDI